MTAETSAWSRAFLRPGAVVFATLFLFDSMARSILTTVIPLQAYEILASERDVSALFMAMAWVGIGATLCIPTLVRRFRPRWVYTAAVVMLILSPAMLALDTFTGLVSGMAARTFATACLVNLINLYIMAYIKKRDLSRSEPLRTLFAAAAWSVGPMLGPFLYENVSPHAVYGVSAGCAVLLLVYFWWLRLEYGPALASDEPARNNPLPHIRRFFAQPRLVLAWLLNFVREAWWVMFFIYTPIYMKQAGLGGTVGGVVVSGGTALLFLSPVYGWLARRFGLRRQMAASFLLTALATLAAVPFVDGGPWLVAAAMLLSAVGMTSVDTVSLVPFMRAVRSRERPEMTMVFTLYRDAAALAPMAIFALLLTFFDLSAVYVTMSAMLFGCVWLCRYVPRSM